MVLLCARRGPRVLVVVTMAVQWSPRRCLKIVGVKRMQVCTRQSRPVTLFSTAICLLDGRYRATIATSSRRLPQRSDSCTARRFDVRPVALRKPERLIPALSASSGRVQGAAVLPAGSTDRYNCHHSFEKGQPRSGEVSEWPLGSARERIQLD